MPMVHVLHNEYQVIVRLIILNSTDPATLIQVVVLLVLPLKLQYILTLMYPVALSYVYSLITAYVLLSCSPIFCLFAISSSIV
jgi:hypothetical protein